MAMMLTITLLAIISQKVSSFSCGVSTGSTENIGGTTYNCNDITIDGTLNIASNTILNADRIEVSVGGELIIGTSTNPVSNVKVYLNHQQSNKAGTTSGQLMSYGTTKIYGTDKTSWSTLTADASAGTTTITVQECDNWSNGDLLVITATGGQATTWYESTRSKDNYRSEERYISSIDTSSCTITLDNGLSYYHRGSMYDDIVPMYAEVLNLDRSVTITGPDPLYYTSGYEIDGFQGIVTRQSGSDGVMQIDNVRIENCGRVELGEYCLHFHYAGDCPECRFRGNAVVNGNNKGITIHGTHNSLVDNNVIYDIRGAYIYVEDGNEYDNTISNNVMVCPEINNYILIFEDNTQGTRCMLNGVSDQIDADMEEQSGIYMNTASNHIIGNHVIGMENALFINTNKLWGQQGAEDKVCKLAMPVGVTKGNVFHNNAGFGWYVNSLYSTNVLTNSDGFVTDWTTCQLFDPDTGNDQSSPILIEDHIEYFEDFSMGVYECGDLTFKNTISALNNKGFYWKSYRRGENSDAFCDECIFYNNHVQVMGAGGSAKIEFKDSKILSTMSDGNKINVNHHCGLTGLRGSSGGLCAPHYVFNNVDFGTNTPVFYTETHNSYDSYLPSDVLISYNGYTYYDIDAAHPTFNTGSCSGTVSGQDGPDGSTNWMKCADSLGIRIIRIFSPNRGSLTASTTSGTYTIPFRDLERLMMYNEYTTMSCGTGPLDSSSNCNHRVWPAGYTFIIKNGETITLNVPSGYSGSMSDTFVMEYSEPQLDSTSITMTIIGDSNLAGGPCIISNSHSRAYISQYGPMIPQSGAWWICKGSSPGTGNSWTVSDGGITQFKSQMPYLFDKVITSSSSTDSVKGQSSSVKTYTTTPTAPTAPTPQPTQKPTDKPTTSPPTVAGQTPKPTTTTTSIKTATTSGGSSGTSLPQTVSTGQSINFYQTEFPNTGYYLIKVTFSSETGSSQLFSVNIGTLESGTLATNGPGTQDIYIHNVQQGYYTLSINCIQGSITVSGVMVVLNGNGDTVFSAGNAAGFNEENDNDIFVSNNGQVTTTTVIAIICIVGSCIICCMFVGILLFKKKKSNKGKHSFKKDSVDKDSVGNDNNNIPNDTPSTTNVTSKDAMQEVNDESSDEIEVEIKA